MDGGPYTEALNLEERRDGEGLKLACLFTGLLASLAD